MSITKSTSVISEYEGSIYNGFKFDIGKTIWNVVIRTDKNGDPKGVTVKKSYPNPFGSIGKDFASIDEAVSNYKKNLKIYFFF